MKGTWMRPLRMVFLAACCIGVGVADSFAGPRGKANRPRPLLDARGGQVLSNLMQAEMHLAAKRPRLAMTAYRRVLDEDPDNGRAQLGLLKVLALTRVCGDADALFEGLEGTARHNAKAHAAQADCAAHHGQLEAALEYYARSIELDPYEPEPRQARAELLSRMGRLDEAALEREGLFGTERGPPYAFLAEAEELHRLGDPTYAAALEQLKPYLFLDPIRKGQQVIEGEQTILQECESDPELTLRLSLVNPDLAAASAECRRRHGLLEAAEAALTKNNLRVHLDAPTLAPIHARVLIDAGQLAEAERVLAGLPESLAPVLASRWYLERARGNDEAATSWARRYTAHPGSVVEPIEALIPRETPE